MKIKDTRKYWMWLSHACGAGSKVAVSLVRHFGNAYNVYCCDEDSLADCNFRVDKRIRSNLLYKDISDEEDIIRWCDSIGVRIICPDDTLYPLSLRALVDAPMVLYTLGVLPDFENTFTCAVVGTRSMSEYGREMSYKFGHGLASGGAGLVSGLALGCDAMAMKGALDAGGTTVAVLGCGIDVVYPKENEALLERVLNSGAVITEFSPGVSPLRKNFPIRNRIISGISQSVCVIEGNMRSGSLITARHAVYQGRELFAVPGKVGEIGAEGTNHLIKNGAEAVTSPEDILSRYELIYPHTIDIKNIVTPVVENKTEDENIRILTKKKKKSTVKNKKTKEEIFSKSAKPSGNVDFDSLSEEEKRVYRAMMPDIPMLAEEICNVSGMPVSTVMASLTLLEISGAVESGAGGYFMRHADDEEVGEPAITELDEGI
ncbi:MAG: DNA-processing protein DprA [Clostridia bacterium]|nr:DNA-processing protein DprA [Clostridia bacterium]